MFARGIVVEAEPALTYRATFPEEAQIVRGDAAVLEKPGHAGCQLASERQVQREMLERVFACRLRFRLPARRVEMLDRFALHENRVRTLSENCFNRQLVA